MPGVVEAHPSVLTPNRRDYFCRDVLGQQSAQVHPRQFSDVSRLVNRHDALCHTAVTISGEGGSDEVPNRK